MLKSLAKRRVCFVSSRSAFMSNEGEIITDWANGRLITELSKNSSYEFSLAIFKDPILKRNYNHQLNPSRLYVLPFPMSYFYGLRNSWKVSLILRKIERENDILIVQLPIISFLPLLFLRKPIIYHLCANVLTASNNPIKYRGMMAFVARSFASLMHVVHKRLFSRANVQLLVNGSELAELYKSYNPVAIVSSSLLKEDMTKEIPNRRTDVFKILFMGRPSLEKGFDVITKSLDQLEFNFRLTVVGFSEAEFKNMLPELFRKSSRVREKIDFMGYINWGSELKELIQQHHVLVVPSISEGTPRVILEAYSQGVPPIGTRVGGIPDLIADNISGFLINAGDVVDLVNKLSLIRSDTELHKKLSLSALEMAKGKTVKDFANHFIKAIENVENE